MSKRRKIAAFIIILVVFFFIGKVLCQNWSKIPFQELKFNVGFLAISYTFQFCYFILGALAWKFILKALDVELSLKRTVQINAISDLGRYVPGKVWAFLGKIYLAKREGIPSHKTIVSIILTTILLVLSALIIFLASLIFFTNKGLPTQAYLLLALIPLCFIFLHPRVLPRVVNWGLKKLKREPIRFDFNYAQIMKFLGIYFFLWIIHSANFFFLIRSFYPISYSIFFPLVGINSISWIIGFLSFIVPGGLGIREGILIFLLKFFIPLPIGIISALILRIWVIIGMFTFFAMFISGFRKGEVSHKQISEVHASDG